MNEARLARDSGVALKPFKASTFGRVVGAGEMASGRPIRPMLKMLVPATDVIIGKFTDPLSPVTKSPDRPPQPTWTFVSARAVSHCVIWSECEKS